MERLSGPSGVVLSDPEFESPAPREGFCFCSFFWGWELSLCGRLLLLLRVGGLLHLHQDAKWREQVCQASRSDRWDVPVDWARAMDLLFGRKCSVI
jgi:hypothetical protein